MKKTVLTLAVVVMMMSGAIACAQQPEKKTGTSTEQTAPAKQDACTGTCAQKDAPEAAAEAEQSDAPASAADAAKSADLAQ